MEMRLVQIEDLPTLLRLMGALQEDDPWSVPFREELTLETLRNLVRHPDYGRAWLVQENGKAIGYIVMSFDFSLEYGGRNAWVDEFFIERPFRGKGIGTRVLEFFEEAARDAGATAIHLEVNQGNKAVDLYRRRGFTDHHRYLMTKWLA
jgi:GNAT superfamily N-acetyltransferase